MKTIKSQLRSTVRQWRDSPHLWDLRGACIRNAIDLLKEARILYKHWRYPRSFALAYTAYEEFGKGQIVSHFITGVCSEDEFRSAFRRHDFKSAYNLRKIAFHVGQHIPPTVEYDEKESRSLFRMRMNSLYVDCSDDYVPLIPKGQITSRIAKEAIEGVNRHIVHVLRSEQFSERIGTEALAK